MTYVAWADPASEVNAVLPGFHPDPAPPAQQSAGGSSAPEPPADGGDTPAA